VKNSKTQFVEPKKHMFDFEAEFTRLGRATSADEIPKIRDAAEVEWMRAQLSGRKRPVRVKLVVANR
jgi:hypothetical protein